MLVSLVYACDYCQREFKYGPQGRFGRRDKIYPLTNLGHTEICRDCLRRGMELLSDERRNGKNKDDGDYRPSSGGD